MKRMITRSLQYYVRIVLILWSFLKTSSFSAIFSSFSLHFSQGLGLWLFWLPYIVARELIDPCEQNIERTYMDGYTGWPRNNGTVDTVDFSELCSNQQLFSLPSWIEHLFHVIITRRSSNLVENFLFYETLFMDCHYRNLHDFENFEARWQINGKSQKWQWIRNYS